jgi:hypothetical protein
MMIFHGGKDREEEIEMECELPEERRKFIALLLQRLGNEDWGKWLAQEKHVIDSMNIPPDDEIARTCREQWYDHLLRKIQAEIDYLRRQ